jgi:ankyrin repeat protein
MSVATIEFLFPQAASPRAKRPSRAVSAPAKGRAARRFWDGELLAGAILRRTERVRQALEHGADGRAATETGVTALMALASHGEWTLIAETLERFDARQKDKNGEDALMSAAMSGCELSVRALLGACDPRSQSLAGHTALMKAAAQRSGPCVAALLPASNPLATDELGESALMKAAKTGGEECVRLLLAASAAKARDHGGRDALMHAAGDPGLTELLLPFSDPLARDAQGDSALAIAARAAERAQGERREEILRGVMALASVSDVLLSGSDGRRPGECLERLLGQGASAAKAALIQAAARQEAKQLERAATEARGARASVAGFRKPRL